MGHYVHRTTKREYKSTSPTDLLAGGGTLADFIEDPDLSGVVGVESKYWDIVGDTISEMSQADKDALDAAQLDALKDAVIDELDLPLGLIKAVFLVMLDEFNLLRAEHGLAARTVAQLKNALRGKL